MGQTAAQLCRDRSSHNLDVTKPPKLNFWIPIMWSCAAIVILFEVYAPAIRAPFFFDDYSLPFTLQSYRSTPLKEWLSGVRPVLMFTYWINYQQVGIEPRSYHLVNIWLHFLNTVLVFLIIRRI